MKRFMMSLIIATAAASSALAQESTLANCQNYKIVFTGTSSGWFSGVRVSTSQIWIEFENGQRRLMSLGLNSEGGVARVSEYGDEYVYTAMGSTKELRVYSKDGDQTLSCN